VSFLAPGRLWLLPLVAALAVAYLLLQRRRTTYAVRFTELDLLASVAPRRPGWRRHVPAGLLLLSLVLLTVGFARPQAQVSVPRERATVVVALDVSLSMSAVDVDPDRITSARQAAATFVRDLPERFNVGLVAFSGQAALSVPPTQDHEAVVRAVGSLELGPGTAIGEAVFTALDAVRLVPGGDGQPPAPARLVLLSDGSNTVGRPLGQAEEAAKAAGVPVSTIAFGTGSGSVVVEGQRVPVPVDGPSLRRLAEATGGAAYSADSSDALRHVYDDIGSQVGTVRSLREVTGRLTGLGLLAVAAAAVTALLWSPRMP
jgi:Ca-activated chloride channel homolog